MLIILARTLLKLVTLGQRSRWPQMCNNDEKKIVKNKTVRDQEIELIFFRAELEWRILCSYLQYFLVCLDLIREVGVYWIHISTNIQGSVRLVCTSRVIYGNSTGKGGVSQSCWFSLCLINTKTVLYDPHFHTKYLSKYSMGISVSIVFLN